MKKQLRYSFKYIESCNMCGESTEKQIILGKRLNSSQGKSPNKKIGVTTTVAKCANCGLIYSNPQPVPFDIQDHYGVAPENYWKEDYFESDPSYFQSEIKKLKELLDFRNGMKSLDIGAGLGKGMMALADAGFDAYGFEPSVDFYERAIKNMGVSPAKLKVGMMEEMVYSDNIFDFISFGAVLEHLYDPSASILKAMRWLKPNGIIHIEVPSSDWLTQKLINFYYKLKGTDYVGNLSPMHVPYHLYEFTLKSFQQHARKHRYEIAFHQYYVCKTYMPKVTDFLLASFMKWTDQGMQLCVWLKKRSS